MKVLHTSDWHLGRTLYAKKERQEEHAAFLDWLLATIKENSIDLLIIAGDIFDNSAPNSTSQKMYYDFLLKVHCSKCKNVIVIGGNHDSPSFLNAPKDILAALDVRVMGNAGENEEDEVMVLEDTNKNPMAIVCAVPFLRERDMSRFLEGENYTDRSKRVEESVRNHYRKVAEIAENKRKAFGKNIPIIATGHLSVAGGKTTDDDGVREIYIGNIEAVSCDIFPQTFDYVALGHYHIPSIMKDQVRYCGSPIPMGFGEAEQKKCVYVIEFQQIEAGSCLRRNVQTIEIPVFQELKSVCGDKQFIESSLAELKKTDGAVWVEIIYNGNEIFPDFAVWANEQIAHSKIEILKLQNRRYLTEVLTKEDSAMSLDEFDKFDVFDKLLEKNNISDEQKGDLKASYKEIVDALNIEI